jgi:toxin FitB
VSYLWDTCVLSELGKPNRDPNVASFLAGIPTGETWISAITVGEIEFGIARLPMGKRRAELEAMMNTMLSELSSRVLPVTADVARVWGGITAQGRNRGYTIEVADGLIAATTLHHGLRVVTRNVKDFEPTGVRIINPWVTDS